MDINKIYTLAVMVFGLGVSSAASAVQTPNFYECTGKGVNLTLAVGSKAEVSIMPAQTSLKLKIGKKSYVFQESDITTESTLIGDLWEVTLRHVPDLYIDYASVVIPNISLGGASLSFKSKLILTRIETPFTPNVFQGVVNPSRYVDIACQASVLYY